MKFLTLPDVPEHGAVSILSVMYMCNRSLTLLLHSGHDRCWMSVRARGEVLAVGEYHENFFSGHERLV
jgi:hypothetical protein